MTGFKGIFVLCIKKIRKHLKNINFDGTKVKI